MFFWFRVSIVSCLGFIGFLFRVYRVFGLEVIGFLA